MRFVAVIVSYCRVVIILVNIWAVVVVISFRVGPAYFQLSGQVAFSSLQRVSSILADSGVLTRYSSR
jgi:hypothetical protein